MFQKLALFSLHLVNSACFMYVLLLVTPLHVCLSILLWLTVHAPPFTFHLVTFTFFCLVNSAFLSLLNSASHLLTHS